MTIRFVRSPLLIAIVFFTLLPQVFSQEITHDTPATNDQLTAWLHSNDPRLVAWAATLANERKQTAFIALLPDWLKQSPLIKDFYYSPSREENRAYDAVLDALLRGGSQPPIDPSALRELGRTYPIQAFLLLDRLPVDQQLPILTRWFSAYEQDRRRSDLARISAMRLAQWPSPVHGFAAHILATSEEQFTVDLRSKPPEEGGQGGVSCGDSFARQPAAGWPVVYFPKMEETIKDRPFSTSDTSLVTLDDDHVSYRWVEENAPGGGCGEVSGFEFYGFDQQFRHEIVAHWLKQPQNLMKWQVTRSATIMWTTHTAFDLALGRLLEREQTNFTSMANDLEQKGLLSNEESTWARPNLVVRVVCHIRPCPIKAVATEPLRDYGPLDF